MHSLLYAQLPVYAVTTAGKCPILRWVRTGYRTINDKEPNNTPVEYIASSLSRVNKFLIYRYTVNE
jgi:hypothetical protein